MRLQAFENLDRFGNARLIHSNPLEAPCERAIFFKMLAVFLVSRRANEAKRTLLQRWLQQIGRVQRAA